MISEVLLVEVLPEEFQALEQYFDGLEGAGFADFDKFPVIKRMGADRVIRAATAGYKCGNMKRTKQ